MFKLVHIHFVFVVINLVAFGYANVYMKREFSLVKPYQGASMTIPNWDFVGSTVVTPNYVRLTPDLQSKSGALWNLAPVMSQNWEIVVNFKVSGKGKEYFGDGFAIWYAKDRLVSGPMFGSKDHFSGLAIIMDTYSNQHGPQNHQHPYIGAMINNGSFSYDHDRDGTHTQLSGCVAKFRNFEYDTQISIKYSMEVLTVYTDLENNNQWKLCFESINVKLPTGYYLGASATTGDLSDNHDIISIKFYELQPLASHEALIQRLSIIPDAGSYGRIRVNEDAIKPSASNVKFYSLILLGMVAAVGFAICGSIGYSWKPTRHRRPDVRGGGRYTKLR